MRLTQLLNKQHIDFMFKKHWQVQGNRVPIETGVEQHLKSLGIPVQDALEFIKEKPEETNADFKYVGFFEPPMPLNKDHADFKERPCYTLQNTNVLLEGLYQAQVLTKTIVANGKLPSKIEELAKQEVSSTIHQLVKKAILSANVFDCEQKKLPKIKDPERPAVNFPRVLGITDLRRNVILSNKLLQIIERSSDIETTNSKYVVSDVHSRATLEKEEDLLQFQETSNILVTGNQPLKHDMSEKDIPFMEIPDLYPVKHTVTIPTRHFYTEDSVYPIQQSISKIHPHTTWLHFNETEVSNIYETYVTPEQRFGRALTHAFAIAAAYAKQIYGNAIRDLPEPVYINCIQTTGQIFDFGVLQLNTLNLDGRDGTKNVWYTKTDQKMYESSRYFGGMPSLEKYNPEVYSYINAFYKS